MDHLFEIRPAMAAETANSLGEGVAVICVQLPQYLDSQLADMEITLDRLQIADPGFLAVIQDMRHNTEVARKVEAMIATLIGCATPVRVNPKGVLQ